MSQGSATPGPDELSAGALDAYSRVVIEVAAAVIPHVAALQVSGRGRDGRAIQGAVPRFKIAAFKAWPAGYLGLYKLAKKAVSSEGGLFVPGNGYSVDHLCAVIRRN